VSAYFSDNQMEEGHGRKSLRGGAVSVVARAVNALVQIGSVLFMARLLTPEDYGLVSMVTAIIGFASVFVDLGTRDAVVQRSRVERGEVSALFWITMAIGAGLSLLVALSGPLIARFYGEPRLTMITVVSSLTFITAALSAQHYALLRRAMQFQAVGMIEVGANVLSAAGAIAMAFAGFGYWALVLRPIAMAFLLAVGVWWQCRWLPTRPSLTPGVKEMLRFGINSTGFTMTDFAGRSADRVAIGYGSGPTGLGYYQNARFVYDNLLDVLVFPVHGVAVASLSKLRDRPQQLREMWAKALSVVTFYSMPAFGLLAVMSRDLLVLLLGSKWAAAGVLLSILALRGIPHGVERTLGWLHVAAGRTDRWMRWGVFATLLQFVALAAGLPYGARGVCIAYVISTFILFIPAIAYAGRPLGIGAADVVGVCWRQLVGSLAACSAGFFVGLSLLEEANRIGRLCGIGVTYVIVYLVIVVGWLRLRAPLQMTFSLIRESLPAPLGQFVRQS
jgi:PST family polysaccharide transporter